MIDVKSVYKQFGDKVLFADFNIQIEDGEFVIFNGESGCGKTTLLNMIGSLEPIDSGAIFVNGKDISKKRNQREYLRNDVGFLFQNFALVEGKTVRQNLNMIKKSVRSDLSIEDCLNYVGLLKEIDTQVYKLSGGEQQRIALARLLLKKCTVILADEPTGSLDKKNANRVIELLQGLNQMKKTIIMVTHVEEHKYIGTRNVDITTKSVLFPEENRLQRRTK